jgi:hypothetical protein
MLGPVKTLGRAVVGVVALWVLVRLLLAWAGASTVAETLGMAAAESWFLSTFGPALLIFGVFEVAVIVSAVLDWRDAKLAIATRREAWAAAHITVLLRTYRRTRWVHEGIKLAWKRRQEAKKLAEADDLPYVQLDPTQPFDGQIIDVVDDGRQERSA